MRKIYLNNFKGFNEKIIELADTNFMVGENSTGKTSFLKLINLLCNNEFWINYKFNNNQVEFGYFDEIISKQSNEKEFRIGIEKIEDVNYTEPKEKLVTFRILFSFKEEKSIPVLSSIKVQDGSDDIFLKITKGQVLYKNKKSTKMSFSKWVKDFNFNGENKKLPIPTTNYPLYFLVHFIKSEIYKDSKEDTTFQFMIDNNLISRNYKWLAPIRAKAKRTYEAYKDEYSAEGEHIPSLLRQILVNRKTKKKSKIISILEEFGKDSQLFDRIIVNEYAKKTSSPFEIIIKYKSVPIKLHNVGYGVSQALPILIEVVSSERTLFSIQQPEVHLHPRAQSAFGSFLFNSCKNDKNTFIIETHSDYTINRYRYKLSKTKDPVNFSSKVFFFERKTNGNSITEIKINTDGSYQKAIPKKYRNFFIDEELKLLSI